MATRSDNIIIQEKPDWVSWDEIHEVLWTAHAQNREKGMNMAFSALSGDQIKEMIDGHGKMFVALCNGKVVGTAAIKIKHAKMWCGNGDYAHFCFASVLPEFNGLGIYKELCRKREIKAQEMGINRLLFDTHEKNKRIIDVNRRNGYKLIGIIVCKDHYNVKMVKWIYGCPYSDLYCKCQYLMRKYYKKIRFKPGKIKRFGI